MTENSIIRNDSEIFTFYLPLSSCILGMSVNTSVIETKQRVRVRGIALPNEHGAWGFLFEPLIGALAIAFSQSGVWIALLFIGAFLTRQPLKILVGDWLASRRLPQTAVALKFTFLYGAIFLLGLAGSLAVTDISAFLPLILIAPFGIYQIYCDVSRQSRELLPELTGAVAISSSAAVVALAGGWAWPNAFALWAVFIARLIPSILYVRNRLRLEKEKDFSVIPVHFAHLAAIFAVGMLALNNLIPKLTLFMFLILTIRAVWGLSPFRKKVKAMKIGIWEVIYGTLTALSVIFGYYLQI